MTNTKNNEKIGATFDARVKDLASDGRGIINHPDGRTYFVAGVWKGEKITAKITQIKGRIGFAECIEIQKPSEYRNEPQCAHHGANAKKCGGCPWQFITYEQQLQAKQERVEKSFSRLGLADKIKKIWPAPNPFSYRNRAQFKTDGKHIGYVSPSSNTLAPIEDCLILSDHNRNTLKNLLNQLPNEQWEAKKRKQWVTLDIDDDITAEEVSINKRRPFQQANNAQNTRMREWLSEKLSSLDKNQSVLELFCGSGNLTEIIAEQKFSHIRAADVAGEAIDTLEKRQLENVEPIRADLFSEEGFRKTVKIPKKNAEIKSPEILVLDPPRDGLKIKDGLFDKKSKIKHMLYISCDLATLVRDIATFAENGYRATEIQPLDQFPHTPHIEVLVVLVKMKIKRGKGSSKY